MRTLAKIESLLMLLYSMDRIYHQQNIDGRTKLQKIIYLIGRQFNLLDFGYVGYHYGPYSKELQNIIDKLVAFNILNEEIEYIGNRRYGYSLTETGIAHLETIWQGIDDEQQQLFNRMAETASQLNQMNLNEILPLAYEAAENEGIM